MNIFEKIFDSICDLRNENRIINDRLTKIESELKELRLEKKDSSCSEFRTFTPHIPAFIDIDPVQPKTFRTVQELLQLDFVKKFNGFYLLSEKTPSL